MISAQAEPFNELKELVDATSLTPETSSDVLSHVPYVVILIKCIEEWKASHDGAVPGTFAEKNEFKDLLKKKESDLSLVNAENFAEAYADAYRAWTDPRDLPDPASAALRKSHDDQTTSPTPFKTTLKAIREWSLSVNNGLPPLAGAVPDMHADTTSFIALQRAYAAKAKRDTDSIKAKIPTIDPSFVETMCRHLADVKFVATTSIHSELNSPPPFDQDEMAIPQDDDAVDLLSSAERMPRLAYLALRAADSFFQKFQRWPSLPVDIEPLKTELTALFPVPSLEPHYDAWATEFVRGSTCELHAVSSVIGGVASQEAVKIIAKQFTPLTDVFIFDGCSGAAAVLDLNSTDDL